VETFRKAGWRALHLTIRWDPGKAAPWLLRSTQPGAAAAVRAYRRRASAEATYEDCKTRGWTIEASRITGLNRLTRLLLHLVFWGATQLGLRAIRTGQRRCFDRAGRRTLSVVRIGRAALAACLDRRQTLPPRPFRRTPTGPVFTWLA
jgi:hypothetical protein